ncbi:MAG: Outer rane efflux protein [Burkholderia sp.]|nr:Outer rane efflux protein [Burkholderia sp.]
MAFPIRPAAATAAIAACSKNKRWLRPIGIALAGLALSGCVTLSKDGGLDAVSALTRERTGHPVQRQAPSNGAVTTHPEIAGLLAQPLTPDSAVRIALANNQGLQATFAELGVAEADLVQAGRLRNPGVSFSRLRGGEDIEIDRSILFDFVGLLTLPLRSTIESRRFEQAKLQAAGQAVQLAADTRRAYFTAVAAQQAMDYAGQVAASAEAGAQLAERMNRVGNWSKLDQARQQAFHADATAQLARARHQATEAREQLTRLLGVWGADIGYQLPERLPDLPDLTDAPDDAAAMESRAMTQRLDVQMARRNAEATASALGLSRATGFINVFDAGYTNKSEIGKPRANGYEIVLELPVFDWGGARIARAEATYMQAVYRTADIAVRARSEVRAAYSAYRASHAIARHYRDEVVPLRKRISDEVLLRYNGMLASVFELLADARDQIGSVNAAIDAQKDFWIAETGLQAAINGAGGGSAVELRGQASAAATSRGH